MRLFELGEEIASRTYLFEESKGATRDIRVAVGKPKPDDTDTWFCPYQITGIGRDHVQAMFGADSLQALLSAVHIIPVKLAVFVEETEGRLLYEMDADTTLLSGCALAMKHAADTFPVVDEPPG